jgi:hypothetical protein
MEEKSHEKLIKMTTSPRGFSTSIVLSEEAAGMRREETIREN